MQFEQLRNQTVDLGDIGPKAGDVPEHRFGELLRVGIRHIASADDLYGQRIGIDDVDVDRNGVIDVHIQRRV